MTHSLISLNKSCVRACGGWQSIAVDIFTNKLDNSDNTAILWAFLLILILNHSYHQTHTADELTYIIAKAQPEALSSFRYPFFLSHLSYFFSQLHEKHFETNEKISNGIDESNTPFYNKIDQLVWWVGWIHFLFSSLFSREKTAFNLLAFFSLQRD